MVGLDFMAHPFWDKFLEFEERHENPDKIFSILERVVHIPMHQYARYFERYRSMSNHRPTSELVPADILEQFRSEVESRGSTLNPSESEQEIRLRVDSYYLEIFHRTQTETTKRWQYESEIKRPYFHVTELEEAQLVNWRRYLDFEEVEGDFTRTVFLYERCLVTCANYDEFWHRYVRWMSVQKDKEEEVRNIYLRAACVYVPIGRPSIRLLYAAFEESQGRVEVAKAVHDAVLMALPGHFETIQSLANLSRRHGGLEAAIAVYKAQLDSQACDLYTKAWLVAEWAKLLWQIKGSPDEARSVFAKNAQYYLDCRPFWIQWLQFEIAQPTAAGEREERAAERIKAVHEKMRADSHLSPLVMSDLSHYYMVYLLERGGPHAAKEYMELDREVNG